MKKKKPDRSEIIIAIVIIMLIITTIYLLISNQKNLDKLDKLGNKQELQLSNLPLEENPLSLEGYSKVNISVQNTSLVIKSNCTVLSVEPHPLQVYSIQQALNKEIEIRPMNHEIVASILEHFNLTLVLTKITDYKEGIYFANIYIKNENSLLNIDIKPSDAIALSLRTNTPIYIKDATLKEKGTKIC
ncbi:bifunctional nuclease family protein [Candidatus Woesearchaeota archaeon]|nr:bifunctional nuclease family protein [Candidatus Woesearchaeota archaeon]